MNGSPRSAGAGVAFLSNALEGPDDEATRRFARIVAVHASALGVPVIGVSRCDSFLARTTLLSPRLIGEVRRSGASAVVYLPAASASTGTFLRVAALRALARVRVVLIALQPPRRAPRGALARACAPDLVLTPSASLLCALRHLRVRSEFLPMGVDTDRFRPADAATKQRLRRAYALPAQRPLVLHVGHLQPLRNLAWVSRLRASIDAEVVVVGGTAMGADPAVSNALAASGVRVINRYLSRIEEMYQLADGYVFPVVDGRAAIGVPLSVLEAMACNLPTVTTPFGGLPRMVTAGDGLFYARTCDEFVQAVRQAIALPPCAVRTREKVLPYAWRQTVARVFDNANAVAGSRGREPTHGRAAVAVGPANGGREARRG